MDIEIDIGVGSFKFPTSYVFDPYPRLQRWLEAVVRGEAANAEIDAEGWAIYLMSTAAASTKDVRFTVVFEHTGPGEPHTRKTTFEDEGVTYTHEHMCDVVLTRSAFVRAFYRALIDGWEQPEPDWFWDGWYNTSREICEQDGETYGCGRYAMTSDLIKAFLAP